VLPFRSALLGAARAALATDATTAGVAVQPVAVAYTHRYGMPLGRQGRALVAWPGDVALVPHLLRLVAAGGVDVAVAFGTPRVFAATTDRKALAAEIEAEVRTMVLALNNGRDPLRPPLTATASASQVEP
jgi:1-acyl-sn-glycerol-3-phosphate acyltransferase